MNGVRCAEVAGAGFAGLVAATALARAGWAVRVHEGAPGPRSVGSGIYVFPFAQGVLESVGALDQVRRHAVAPPHRTIMINGERRSTTTLGDILTTTRAALHEALLEAAKEAGVAFAWGSKAVGASASGVLRTASGAQPTADLPPADLPPADLVVIADGARSGLAPGLGLRLHRVRHTDGITRVLLDRTGMRGPEWDGVLDMYDYRFQPRRVLYTPCGADAFYLCLMTPEGDEAGAAVPVDASLWVRSFPLLAPAFLRIGTLGRHDRYGTTRLDRWSQGRAAVVGDAAHAMPSSLGQGAGVSMLNALRMAEAVAGGDVLSGLARWEADMRPIVERWQAQAEKVAADRSLASAHHPGHDLPAEAATPLEAA